MFNHEQGIGAVHTRHIHLTENLADQGPLYEQHVNQSEYDDRFNKRVLSFHVVSICVVCGSPLFDGEHIPKGKVLELAISKARDMSRGAK